MKKIYDCAIIGGGPAGLNAGLVLGRAKRNVILFDDNTNRNQVTRESHGFITRDGASPAEFREIGRKELLSYPSVQLANKRITSIEETTDQKYFVLTTLDEDIFYAEKIILACGIKEELPPINGVETFYGTSLFNCPYCDGWELRDQPLIVISDSIHSVHLSKLVYNWSNDLVLATNGLKLDVKEKAVLEEKGIKVIEDSIKELRGNSGQLEQVEFVNSQRINRTGGFVAPNFQLNPLREILRLDITDEGSLVIDELGRTSRKHVYAAGDAVDFRFSQLISSAASGSKAAAAVNADLTSERF
ncbi:NAD(P)/FAD-dependent oxidoreductase [Alkalicoccobacillus porphyridii]|nr:NAD(P)/FAD-dependent oxidoreductase [Alkalicoccobacillus porphyridii]